MKAKKIFTTLVLLSVATYLTSCWYNRKWEDLHPYGQNSGPGQTTVCDTSAVVSYSTTIQPMIVTNCATGTACHVSHGAAPTNYNNFAVLQADALTPAFMQRIDLPSTNALHMPQNNLTTLDPCDTMKLRKWIHAGCPQN